VKTGLFAACFGLALGVALSAQAAEEPRGAATEKPTPLADPAPEPTPSTEAAAAPAEKGGTEPADDRFGHGMQFGLRAGVTGGYRMIFRYDKSPFCREPEAKSDKDQQKFCGNGAPPALDLALSFAPLDFVEPYVWGRFGLSGEASTNTSPLVAIGVGARIYTMSDSKLKIFVEPAIGVELEGGAGNSRWVFRDSNPPGLRPEYKKDFLIHLGVGPQYDFARAFGVYVHAGITTGVLRYIHAQLELSGGVQLRIP
jgi:hypothetical protein